MIRSEWEGSTIKSDKSGTATFFRENQPNIVLKLESVKDYNSILYLISTQRHDAANSARSCIGMKIKNLLASEM